MIVVEELRRSVRRRTAEGVQVVSRTRDLRAESKVAELHESLTYHENIFGFDVSVHKAEVMLSQKKKEIKSFRVFHIFRT